MRGRLPHNTIRRRFFKLNAAPHVCSFCRNEITLLHGRQRESLNVHHLDGDNENNDPENWAAAHLSCHLAWHNAPERNPLVGRKRPDAVVARITAALPRGPLTAEHREKLSRAGRGKRRSAETRTKIAAAARRRWTEGGPAAFGLVRDPSETEGAF